MADYVDQVKARVREQWPNGRCYTLGHVADGNLHPFVVPNEVGDHRKASDACVYEPLRGFGGSISAEHGIGIDKIDWLPHSRSKAEIDVMRVLKKSFDPQEPPQPRARR